MTLRNDNINDIPTPIDWQKACGEDLEGWRPVYPSECFDQNGGLLSQVYEGGDVAFCPECDFIDEDAHYDYGDECPDCDEATLEERTVPTEDSLQPTMNYFYPVKFCGDHAEVASDLRNCTLIEFEDGTYGLALTGGGMDFSWDICRSYIACGQLPPTHFCDLPNNGEQKALDAGIVLAACKRSLIISCRWLTNQLEAITRLEADLTPAAKAAAALDA